MDKLQEQYVAAAAELGDLCLRIENLRRREKWLRNEMRRLNAEADRLKSAPPKAEEAKADEQPAA